MSDAKHSRRDFLRGRAALSAAAGAIESAIDARFGPVGEDQPHQADRRVLTLRRRAMACDFEIRLCDIDDHDQVAAGMAALDVVERVEDQLTVYRETSELIELNAAAASRPTLVEPGLFDLLVLCGRINGETDGAFDPTSGSLSRVWGFHRREGRMPERLEIDEALARTGWDAVRLDPQTQTVRFQREGLELNSNSIGKGYALDRAAEVLADQGLADSLMHGGRSTLLARGDNHQLDAGGWKVGVGHPLRPGQRIAEFTLRDEALSTSGSGTQFFEHEGRRYGHLIDPRTGWPAEGLFSASVLAPTAAEADAYSTAAYILGVEGTRSLCERIGLRALLLAPGESGDVETHAFNLQDADWRPDGVA